MIETERLILRPFEADDIDIIFQIYSDSETLHYTPFDPMSREQAEQHLRRIIEEGKRVPCLSYELAVVLKESGEKIGRTHILIDPETDTGMIGWLLLKEHRGKHYAAEMTEALLSCCFDELGLHRVNAVCNPENTASWNVLERAGMRREALLKQKCRYVKNGVTSWQDELEYAILASEYRSLKNASGRFRDGTLRRGIYQCILQEPYTEIPTGLPGHSWRSPRAAPTTDASSAQCTRKCPSECLPWSGSRKT